MGRRDLTGKCCLLAALALWAGCHGVSLPIPIPDATIEVRQHLTIHADFPLPRRHRLIEELQQRRADLMEATGLPLSDEPVHVYLFGDPAAFHDGLRRAEPLLAGRRAVFIQTDTELRVLALWSDRIGEDLRHEVTHGYLHGAIANPPVWIDEGLAEYFELPGAPAPVHEAHVRLLARSFRDRTWTPSLRRLEGLNRPEELTQLDYAESWLWVHFLLKHSAPTAAAVRGHLAALAGGGQPAPLSQQLAGLVEDPELAVLGHLRQLAASLPAAPPVSRSVAGASD